MSKYMKQNISKSCIATIDIYEIGLTYHLFAAMIEIGGAPITRFFKND